MIISEKLFLAWTAFVLPPLLRSNQKTMNSASTTRKPAPAGPALACRAEASERRRVGPRSPRRNLAKAGPPLQSDWRGARGEAHRSANGSFSLSPRRRSGERVGERGSCCRLSCGFLSNPPLSIMLGIAYANNFPGQRKTGGQPYARHTSQTGPGHPMRRSSSSRTTDLRMPRPARLRKAPQGCARLRKANIFHSLPVYS